MSYSVYKHTSPNGKCYIGITQQIPQKRWKNNGRGYTNNKHFWRAIQKYGWDNFKHEILYTGLTKEEAEQKEIELIAYYDSANPLKGYNRDLGGNSIGKHSEETKRKMSEAQKGEKHHHYNKCYPEEVRKKQSVARMGEKNHFYGKHHSEETKMKIREMATGRTRSEDVKRKLSNIQKSRTQYEINEIFKHRSRRVLCIETGVVYDSAGEIKRLLGISTSQIGRACKGKQKTSCGYHWKYVDENN